MTEKIQLPVSRRNALETCITQVRTARKNLLVVGLEPDIEEIILGKLSSALTELTSIMKAVEVIGGGDTPSEASVKKARSKAEEVEDVPFDTRSDGEKLEDLIQFFNANSQVKVGVPLPAATIMGLLKAAGVPEMYTKVKELGLFTLDGANLIYTGKVTDVPAQPTATSAPTEAGSAESAAL